ncbi:MAG: hypothetical protein ACRYFS_18155 [Janthinobacterium lividum]
MKTYTCSQILLPAILTLAGLASLAAVPVHAQNLVKDGGFENAALGSKLGTKDFTSGSPFDTRWTVRGTVGIDTDNKYVDAGNKSLFLSAGSGVDSISQNLATKINQNYTLSFYADSDALLPLTVTFGGQDVGGGPILVPENGFPKGTDTSGTHKNASDFTFYSYTVTASSRFTGLSFFTDNTIIGNNPDTLELDNISVVPTAPTAPVPEASTTISFGLLLALGLGGLAFAARRKSETSFA